ncbi:MAG: DinB family protein [Bacteroidetes bacterium]|nr:MAG: DinB family protein [Bacteroidota bacterium]
MIEQTPWFERKFDFNFPVGLFPVIVERLRGTTPRIEHIANNKSEGQLSQKINVAWSVKEQVGHLYDLEELWYGRIEDFLAGEKTLRAADLSNTKTHEADHNKKTLHELLTMFSHTRSKLIEKVENFDEATASLTALHPRLQTPMRLIDSLFFVAEHDDHHLAKIRALIQHD